MCGINMHLDVPLKTLFTVDPVAFAAIKDKVKSLDKEEWDRNTFRQTSFSVHAQTKSIIFKFRSMQGPMEDITTYDEWDKWSEALSPVTDQAAEVITGCKDGVIIKAMLAKLPAGSRIAPHRDDHQMFDMAHRIHLPIITNDEVDFTIDGQVYHMKEGVAYEINNKLEHSVKNNSNTGRVHLIFDYVARGVWDDWEKEERT
jgi:aspartyl/asparaginyl beta-hydroxylase (cupin superfamily)